METLTNLDIRTLLGTTLVGILASILMGKTLRRILVYTLGWIFSKTQNKIDNQILEDVEDDLGLDHKISSNINKEKQGE